MKGWLKVGEARGLKNERGRRRRGKKEPNRFSNMAILAKNKSQVPVPPREVFL